MKNKQYANSRTKHQLAARKEKGQTSVVWRLTSDQLDYIKDVLGYQVQPFIYRITTKKIPRDCQTNSLLKEINYKKSHGENRLIKKLSSRDRKMLEEHNIHFVPLKYKILLIG